MTYTPNADYNESDGTSTLSLTISDQGQTDQGGTLTATQSNYYKAINDSPEVTNSEATIEEDNTSTAAASIQQRHYHRRRHTNPLVLLP